MSHPKNQVPLTCEICGKDFSLKASLAKNRRFCSWECRKIQADQTKTITHCKHCDSPIETYKSHPQKYCSYSCEMSARNLTDKNPSYHRDITGENNPMHGRGDLISGERNGMHGRIKDKSPAWKGGRKVRQDGYILVYAPDHPHAISDGNGSNTYILEHRLVMEQHLGRYLLPDEVVHHKDHNPSNNDISNLALFSSHSEHISKAHRELWWYEPNYKF